MVHNIVVEGFTLFVRLIVPINSDSFGIYKVVRI